MGKAAPTWETIDGRIQGTTVGPLALAAWACKGGARWTVGNLASRPFDECLSGEAADLAAAKDAAVTAAALAIVMSRSQQL